MKKIILITGETGALMTHAMLHSCTPEKFDFVEPEPFMITNTHKDLPLIYNPYPKTRGSNKQLKKKKRKRKGKRQYFIVYNDWVWLVILRIKTMNYERQDIKYYK